VTAGGGRGYQAGARGLAAEVAAQVPTLLSAVRSRRPLVHVFANFVTMQAVASATRAIGALPVMALAGPDAEEMAGQADALVLSLGTPTADRLDAMHAAGRRAAARAVPIVLDPVGVGTTTFRTTAARGLLAHLPVAVIRANRGEAAALLGQAGQVRGVESVAPEPDGSAVLLASRLAAAYGGVAAVTGPSDEVADPERVVLVEHGHPWMAAVSGAGCMAAALIGAFCAVGGDRLTATAAALTCFGLAAEIAAGRAAGPGTLVCALLDALYHLDVDTTRHPIRVKEP
jgi:hydroxyethylthiazole kinase